MLKTLAILAALALGFAYPAWPQVPRDGGQQDRPAQKEANGPKLAQPPPLALQVQLTPAKQENDPEEKPSGYQWKELLAPANIPNWVLCFVGGFAGWAAFKTLKAIKRQANTMDKTAADARTSAEAAAADNAATLAALTRQADTLTIQAGHMAGQIAEAKSQVALMAEQNKNAKDRQRARLVIRHTQDPEIGAPESILDNHRPLWVSVFAENIGQSKAFNARASGVVNFIADPEKGVHEDGFFRAFPQIIDAESEKIRLSLAGFGIEFEDIDSTSDSLAISQELTQQLLDGKTFIQASGLLAYQDIFGDWHRTPFRFIWKARGNSEGKVWPNRSVWLDYSPDST